MHGLKILGLVTIGDGHVQAADLRGERVQAGAAANHAGAQLLAVLDHEHGLVRQAADDAVGAVDDEAAADLLQFGQELLVRMILHFMVFERRDDVFVGFKGQAQLFDREVQNVGEDFGIGVVPFIAGHALADRYMKIDCACFTPNDERLENVEGMAKDLKVDGVIQYALMFCQPYAHEGIKVEKRLTAASIPSMSLETDYSMEDVEQLKTRVEAFLETVK